MYFFVIVSSFFIYKILKKSCDKPENRERYPRFANNLDEISNYFSDLNIESRKIKYSDSDLDNTKKESENKDDDSKDDHSKDDDNQDDDNQDDGNQDDDNQDDDSKDNDIQDNDNQNIDNQDSESKINLEKEIKNEEVIENLKKISLEDSISGLSNSQIFKFKNNKIIVGEDEDDNVIINGLKFT